MKEFIAFVKKEFIHIFRDPKTLIILFGLPIAQILIFGYVIRNEIEDVRIAIFDPSKDQVTRDITSKLLASGFFILDENLQSDQQAGEIFKKGKIREVLVFGNDFAENLEKYGKADMQIIADASDPNSAKMIVNYTQGIVMSYLNEINRNNKTGVTIEPRVRMMYNPDLRSSFMFVPGTMALILTLVSAMMTSVSIAREKETGTMEALLVSPLKPIQILAGKVTPYILLSAINAALIITMGYFIFHLPVNGSLLLLFLETLLFITLALSLGIMISTVSNSQQIAIFISAFALLLPTLLLSGFIFPVENMPDILRWFTYIVPTKYFIVIIRNVMLKGTNLLSVWRETLMLAGMTSAFIAVSAARFKIRLD
jgi:ABC-2 type transport system permease protein